MTRPFEKRAPEALAAIVRLTNERHGLPPTVREIGVAIGLRSSSSVHDLLLKMRQAGMIRWESSIARSVRVVTESSEQERGELDSVWERVGANRVGACREILRLTHELVKARAA